MIKINPDIQWKYLNQDIQKYIKENDFYQLGNTYYEMAKFVKNEGKDNTYLINLGYKTKLKFQIKQLKDMKKSGVGNAVEIIATTNCTNIDNNSCKECINLNGKIFSINEVLLSNPLPIKKCLHPYGCRCVYCPTFLE